MLWFIRLSCQERPCRCREAQEALEAEWKKLEDKRAWLVDKVQSKKVIMAEAKKNGKLVHFGSLMDLCFEKHSEQPIENRKYKGRVVFRGDQVKDQENTHAVFNEQTSSSSHMASAKLLDAMARMPGFDGEDADAVGAYTQVVLSRRGWLGGNLDYSSSSQTPRSWRNLDIDDPVVPLRLNLYGHPKAGSLLGAVLRQEHPAEWLQKMRGWDNVFQHRQKKLWLSVYVDDFKLVGDKDSIAPMWKALMRTIDLEPPIPLQSTSIWAANRNQKLLTRCSTAEGDIFKGFFMNKHAQDEQTPANAMPELC